MSQINFTRKTFLEKEEIARLQQFLRDSPSENAIIGNTSKYGILRTDFENDTDFLVEPSSNAGRVKISKAENKAITSDGNMIYQEAIDNIEVPADNLWYWMRIKYNYVTYEKGTVSINANGEVVGTGTQFSEVLRGQGTQVPTKVKFLKMDGTPAVNSGFYEVVDIVNNTNMVLTSAIDFVAENDLRMVVLGTTPLGEMLSTEQQEGLYKYDSCEIEFIAEEEAEVPPHLSSTNPDSTFVQDKMFYIARVRNNAGFVSVDNSNPYVRAEFWEFNVVGLTDKLSRFANLSDVINPDAALSNLGVTRVGRNIVKGNPPSVVTYLRINANGTVSFLPLSEFAGGLDAYLKNLYLNRDKHLSDLLDVAQARNNLNVYSKSEVYDKSEAVSSNVNLKRQVIEIGDWDMLANSEKTIVIQDIPFSSVVNLSATILSDPGGITSKRNLLEGGGASIDQFPNQVRLRLYRDSESIFLASAFNQTSYNRGWVIIEYIES